MKRIHCGHSSAFDTALVDILPPRDRLIWPIISLVLQRSHSYVFELLINHYILHFWIYDFYWGFEPKKRCCRSWGFK